MNGESLSVTVVLTATEQRTASRVLQRFLSKPVLRRVRWVDALCMLIFIVCTYIAVNRFSFLKDGALLADADGIRALWFIIQAVIFAAMALSISIFYEIRIKRHAAFRPLPQRQFVYTVAPQGFYSEELDKNRMLYFWPTIERVICEQEPWFVFIDQAAAFVIPQRVFADKETENRYFQLLQYYKDLS
ncbi:hypothetical protein [Cardiobacterium valvarum]|nr:hypothetical protein [Cardiobacterium valvarum]